MSAGPCKHHFRKTPMVDSAPLSDLFERWRQLRDQGQATPPEQLCPDRPELLPSLRQKIDAFLSVQASGDSPTAAVTRPDTPRPSGSTEQSLAAPRFID